MLSYAKVQAWFDPLFGSKNSKPITVTKLPRLSWLEGWKAYGNDPFHPVKNPKGVIQMDLAENQLSDVDSIVDWIKRNPKASICSVEGIECFKRIANFQDYHGLSEFTSGIAEYMKKIRGGNVTFDPKRVVMAGGATGANEILISCLADSGDAFLVPAPYYPGWVMHLLDNHSCSLSPGCMQETANIIFNRDLCWRTGVQLVPISCNSSNNFKITIKAVKEAYKKNTEQENGKIKGLILTNPSNPLGTILDKETLKDILTFTKEHNIHLVCNEIYAGTVFDVPRFVSIAEIIKDNENCFNKDLVHIVSSLSKDMGFPGFRVGIVYSFNEKVVNCARAMSSSGLVSTQTQYLLDSMLSDDKFVENFLKESKARLKERHEKFTTGLENIKIPYLKSNAGVYCWVDLRSLLKEPTLDAEMSLWKSIISDAKLNISPGSSFSCPEAGWFRICFANIDDPTVDIALKRIQRFVDDNKK